MVLTMLLSVVYGHLPCTTLTDCFDVLLTVDLSTFILVINQLDAQNVCFKISLFHASIGVMIPEAV